ncbi:MAG: GGDEF domain-containing protein [Gemmatimonadota bacterium]|jgi:diguanylate cyclase (GGDEF)-like protein
MSSLSGRITRAVTPPAHRWRWPIFLVCSALVVLTAWADRQAAAAVRLDALYFGIVAVTAWFTGPWSGAGVGFLAVALGVAGEMGGFSVATALWNGAATLAIYLTAVFLLAALRRSWLDQQAAARTDPLTGLPNRRAFHGLLEVEVQRARRYGSAFAVAYLDLDGFKSVNDRYGHQAGDRALRAVGRVLSSELRDADTVARLGGDEFAMLLPETSLDGAVTLMERVGGRLRGALAREGWDGVTASVGVHAPGPSIPDPDEIIRRADDLMYEAKRSGKDRIRAGGPEVAGQGLL